MSHICKIWDLAWEGLLQIRYVMLFTSRVWGVLIPVICNQGVRGFLVNVTLRYFLVGNEGVFMGFVTLCRAWDSAPSSVMLLYKGSRRQGLRYFLGRV